MTKLYTKRERQIPSLPKEEIYEEVKDYDKVSDGYLTFEELYDFRLIYNANLFNEWYKQGKYEIHKSKRHFDGELCFGEGANMFIVVAIINGKQISNHYDLRYWDMFKCEEVYNAKYRFDGHTPQDVLEILKEII